MKEIAKVDSMNFSSKNIEVIFNNDNYTIETVKSIGIFEPRRWRDEFKQPLTRNIIEAKIVHTSNGLAIPLKRFSINQTMQTVEFAGIGGYTEKSKMLNKYSTLKVEMNKLEESIKGNNDRELRRSVTSPVNGVVNKMYFNTVGGIVRAGDNMAQITPIEDSLTIEAKIKTSDRAFVWSGQKVSIEITAYDFSKYGLLEGKIISISSDSFEEKNGASYYLVKVKANDFQFAPDLPILPGMVANINILTGKKTILQYILKPLKDIRRNALVEQ